MKLSPPLRLDQVGEQPYIAGDAGLCRYALAPAIARVHPDTEVDEVVAAEVRDLDPDLFARVLTDDHNRAARRHSKPLRCFVFNGGAGMYSVLSMSNTRPVDVCQRRVFCCHADYSMTPSALIDVNETSPIPPTLVVLSEPSLIRSY